MYVYVSKRTRKCGSSSKFTCWQYVKGTVHRCIVFAYLPTQLVQLGNVVVLHRSRRRPLLSVCSTSGHKVDTIEFLCGICIDILRPLLHVEELVYIGLAFKGHICYNDMYGKSMVNKYCSMLSSLTADIYIYILYIYIYIYIYIY